MQNEKCLVQVYFTLQARASKWAPITELWFHVWYFLWPTCMLDGLGACLSTTKARRGYNEVTLLRNEDIHFLNFNLLLLFLHKLKIQLPKNPKYNHPGEPTQLEWKSRDNDHLWHILPRNNWLTPGDNTAFDPLSRIKKTSTVKAMTKVFGMQGFFYDYLRVPWFEHCYEQFTDKNPKRSQSTWINKFFMLQSTSSKNVCLLGSCLLHFGMSQEEQTFLDDVLCNILGQNLVNVIGLGLLLVITYMIGHLIMWTTLVDDLEWLTVECEDVCVDLGSWYPSQAIETTLEWKCCFQIVKYWNVKVARYLNQKGGGDCYKGWLIH